MAMRRYGRAPIWACTLEKIIFYILENQKKDKQKTTKKFFLMQFL